MAEWGLWLAAAIYAGCLRLFDLYLPFIIYFIFVIIAAVLKKTKPLL
jgi:hypothetical protein